MTAAILDNDMNRRCLLLFLCPKLMFLYSNLEKWIPTNRNCYCCCCCMNWQIIFVHFFLHSFLLVGSSTHFERIKTNQNYKSICGPLLSRTIFHFRFDEWESICLSIHHLNTRTWASNSMWENVYETEHRVREREREKKPTPCLAMDAMATCIVYSSYANNQRQHYNFHSFYLTWHYEL